MIRYLAGWLWVAHANFVNLYPGSVRIDHALFHLSHAR